MSKEENNDAANDAMVDSGSGALEALASLSSLAGAPPLENSAKGAASSSGIRLRPKPTAASRKPTRKRRLTEKALRAQQEKKQRSSTRTLGSPSPRRSPGTARRLARRDKPAVYTYDDDDEEDETSTEEEERADPSSNTTNLDTLFTTALGSSSKSRTPPSRWKKRGAPGARREVSSEKRRRGRRTLPGNTIVRTAVARRRAEAAAIKDTFRVGSDRVRWRNPRALGSASSPRRWTVSAKAAATLEAFSKAIKQPKFRAFCRAEFLKSAIDSYYFEPNEFLECLYEAGMGGLSKLTRKEWSYVRSLLGRPRRASPAFFAEEVRKLRKYRADVRQLQRGKTVVCDENATPFPEEVPARLAVGQTVVAVHPATKELLTGKVTTGARGRNGLADGLYYVDFDAEGVERRRVPDTDIMPFGTIHSSGSRASRLVGPRFPHARGDAHMLANLLRLLDRKEALVAHLRAMNDVVENGGANGAAEVPPQFLNQYSWVVVQAEKTSKELDEALQKLRVRESGIALGDLGARDLSIQLSHLCYQRAREMMQSVMQKLGKSDEIPDFKQTSSASGKAANGTAEASDAATLSPIQNLIVGCMSLVMLVQFCAKRGLAPIGIEATLQSIKPDESRGNSALFQRILGAVRHIKAVLSAV